MNREHFSLGALALGAIIFCSESAHAQSIPTPPLTGPPALPAGSDRFSATAQAEVIYSSNIAGGDATVAALRGVTPKDIDYDLGTTINLQLPIGREIVFLSGNVDLQRHDRNSVLNADNYGITAGGIGHAGACSGSAIGNVSRIETLAEDLAIAVTRNIASQDGINGSVNCGHGAFFVTLQGGYSKVTNTALNAGFIDSDTSNASASIGYHNKTIGDLSVAGQYSKSDYINQPALAVGQPNGFEQYGVSLIFSRRIGLRLSGTASVSLQTLKSPATSLLPASTFNNLGSNVDLKYRVSSRLNLALGYNLSNEASPTVNANFVRVQNIHLSGIYTLNDRISAHLGGYNARSNFQGGIPIFLQVQNSEDTEFDGGISVKVGRKIAVTLDANHINRHADISAFSFSSDQVTLGLKGTF